MRRLAIFLCLLQPPSLCSSAQQTPPPPAWCSRLPHPEYRSLQRLPSPDPWFEVYRVRPGVFALYEPHQSEEVISYLILGRSRALLFDTGLGIGDIARVVHMLTPLPVTVLNSHTHDDHVGGDWQFSDIRSLDTAFSRSNAQGSRADAQAELGPDDLCGALPAGFDRAAFQTRPWHISGWIHDGSTIPLGGRRIEVIATPGHTPDSISLLDRAHGLLFTGDTFYPGTIYLYRPETDLAAYERSLQKLSSLARAVRLLLPSHNVPVASPNSLKSFRAAFLRVQAGEVRPTTGQGSYLYSVDGFSFRMQKIRAR